MLKADATQSFIERKTLSARKPRLNIALQKAEFYAACIVKCYEVSDIYPTYRLFAHLFAPKIS